MRSTSPIWTFSLTGGWAALLLAACAPPAAGNDGNADGSGDEAGERPADERAVERVMQGIWSIGFEQSDFAECPSRGDCPEPTGNDGCWLDFSDEAVEQLDPALRERRDNWRYAMTIRGVREEGGAGFGHLGGYDCRVTATHIVSMERIR